MWRQIESFPGYGSSGGASIKCVVEPTLLSEQGSRYVRKAEILQSGAVKSRDDCGHWRNFGPKPELLLFFLNSHDTISDSTLLNISSVLLTFTLREGLSCRLQ